MHIVLLVLLTATASLPGAEAPWHTPIVGEVEDASAYEDAAPPAEAPCDSDAPCPAGEGCAVCATCCKVAVQPLGPRAVGGPPVPPALSEAAPHRPTTGPGRSVWHPPRRSGLSLT